MVCDLAIVGAGAAGLAAASAARELGLDTVVLEASHRIGGRGYSEEFAPGIAFDLGCHWMHSASLNPFVEIADRFGFHYRKGTYPRGLYINDHWATPEEHESLDRYISAAYAAIKRAADAGEPVSQADVTDRNSPWTPIFDHFTSLGTSVDPDQVAVQDSVNYNDTDENWPLKEGFGNLIARIGADIDVKLNCPVDGIDWNRKEIRVETRKGTVECRAVLITVSTGILGAGDIRFDPVLPEWKQSAIMALPLGTHNRVGILFDRDIFGKDCPLGAAFMFPDSEVQGFSLNAFGEHYACGYTGGRHAVWLERAGQQAAIELTLGHLARVFGSDIRKHVAKTIVTAWHGDPWTKGSYSAAMPGQGHQRIELARPIDGRLYFAGEATSAEFMATAHGAYLSGIASAGEIARNLGVATA